MLADSARLAAAVAVGEAGGAGGVAQREALRVVEGVAPVDRTVRRAGHKVRKPTRKGANPAPRLAAAPAGL